MKLAFLVAVKAKRTWDRLPPEQRQRILDGAKTTVRTQGPVVARKAADTARTQAPVVVRHLGEAARKARGKLK